MLNPHNQCLTCVRKTVSSHLLISSLLQAPPSFEMLCYGKKTWPWFMLTWLMLLWKAIQTIYTTTTETVTTTTTTIQTIPPHLCLIFFLFPLPHLPSLDPKAPWKLWPLRLPFPWSHARGSVDVEKWFWWKALGLGQMARCFLDFP